MMPMRMTAPKRWRFGSARAPVPVVIVDADPRDPELRALRAKVVQMQRTIDAVTAECFRLQDAAEKVADVAAAAVARERVAAQNVARNLDAAAFGAEQKLELALSIMIPEQRDIYDGELVLRGGAGDAGPSIEGRSPKKYLAYQEHIRSARTRRETF